MDRFIMKYVDDIHPEAENYLEVLRNMRTDEERARLKERLNIAVDDLYKAKK